MAKKAQGAAKKLVTAPEENRFWVCNGLVLSDLNELASALESMSDENYLYHANAERNDFSNWVGDILKDTALASTLRRAKTRQAAASAVRSKLAKYQ